MGIGLAHFIAMDHRLWAIWFWLGTRLLEGSLRMVSSPRAPARYCIFRLLNSCAVVVPS